MAFCLCAGGAGAETIQLVSGDLLSGELLESDDASVTLSHPLLGAIVVPRDQIVTIHDAAPAIVVAEPEAEPNPGLFGTGFLAGWNRRIGAGISGAEGNSEAMDVNVEISGNYEDERKRWLFQSAYYLTTADGDTTKNQAFAELTRDFLFPESPWFLFLRGRYDYDQFEAWDHRISGNGGIGYDFVKSDPFDLRGRVGAGVSYTFVGEENFAPEALVGLEAVWRINDRMRVLAAGTMYPDLSDYFEFRTLSTLDWIIDVSERLPLSLKLGVLHEYQSNTANESNDIRYYGALLYDF